MFIRTIKKLFTPDMNYQFNKVSALTLTMGSFSVYSIGTIFYEIDQKEKSLKNIKKNEN